MEIIKALEELKTKIESPRQFMGITFGLNKEECVLLIRRIHNSLPDQVKEAERVVREADRVVGTAQEDASLTLDRAKNEAQKLSVASEKEAERVLTQAQLERDRLLSENEILKAAKVEAENVKAEAESEAARVRRGADDYALEVLSKLESVVGKAMMNIERGKSELQRTTQPVRPALPKAK